MCIQLKGSLCFLNDVRTQHLVFYGPSITGSNCADLCTIVMLCQLCIVSLQPAWWHHLSCLNKKLVTTEVARDADDFDFNVDDAHSALTLTFNFFNSIIILY